MTTLNYILLAVADPQRSAQTYTRMLGAVPVENGASFVLYVLPNGVRVGLWAQSDIEPAPKSPGGIEVTFSEPGKTAVLATHAAWKELGLEIVQEPTEMGFGFTFVAADPDGHRLRVFSRAENPR